jgi:hypothetical protein
MAHTFSLFELGCPRCGFAYPQLLPDDGETRTSLPCPNDGESLVKLRKLTDPSGAASSWTPGGG